MWCNSTFRQLNSIIIFAAIATMTKAAFLNSSSQNLDGRIVGGTETSIDFFPHQASLQKYERHMCGAAILSKYFLITAAHCVQNDGKPVLLKVRVGSSEYARGGAVHVVSRVVVHPQFNQPVPLNNDIALMQLELPLTFTKFVQPISVATAQDRLTTSSVLFVSGWGATLSESKNLAPKLRYTFVSLWNHNVCSAAFYNAGIVTNTMLCAGSESGDRDSCQGDSGGPLVTFVGGATKLVGLISWGIGCADPKYPGVYTSTQLYVNWIQQTITRMTI